MASQQVLFGETVAAMKKALKRTAYESDSDNEIEHYTNRGNKLKKRARFAHQGRLIPPSGPEVYREGVEYAGQQRTIISRNPPVVDDEGFEIDSEDEDEDERVQDAIASAAELNPYANIRLEQLLAPLTASTDLPTHATLSKPFTSQTLTNLANQSCEVVRKENRSLWRIRHLFTRLTGDHTWAPCEMMVGPNDIDLFSDAVFDRKSPSKSDSVHADASQVNGASNEDSPLPKTSQNGASGDAASSTKTTDADSSTKASQTNGTTKPSTASPTNERPGDQETKEDATSSEVKTNGESAKDADVTTPKKDQGGKEPEKEHEDEDTEMQDDGNENPQSGVKSSALNGDDAGSAVSQLLDDIFIHPIFHPPPNAESDKGGLSEGEAEEMRRLVALYVQKQEEVCRGAHKLHEGLLKAERLRMTVLKWSKFEAHSGPNRDMSDGEDWYDKEEWGLAEDLKKGQDEEEEDTGTATKKTRNRR